MNFAIDSNYYSKGYRVQLFPTETQKQFIIRCIELSRYLYNWAIDMEKEQLRLYNEGETEKSFLSVYDLGYKFTKLRQENDFLKEVPRASIENSLNRVEYAFKMYMKKQCNYPRYKSKKNKETYSYQTRGDRMFFEDNLLRIEGLPRNEFIKTRFHSGWNKYSDVKFYCPVIKIDKVGNYWISFNIITEVNTTYFEDNNIQKMDRIIGIDLNNKKRFVLSTGQIYYGPDISKELEKLNKLQRKCSKDIRRNLERTNPDAEQSNRSKKRRIKLNKQYKRIHNIEENFMLQQKNGLHIIDFEGEIPGAAPKDCGNWSMQDLSAAKAEARKYLEEVLRDIRPENLNYPEE